MREREREREIERERKKRERETITVAEFTIFGNSQSSCSTLRLNDYPLEN